MYTIHYDSIILYNNIICSTSTLGHCISLCIWQVSLQPQPLVQKTRMHQSRNQILPFRNIYQRAPSLNTAEQSNNNILWTKPLVKNKSQPVCQWRWWEYPVSQSDTQWRSTCTGVFGGNLKRIQWKYLLALFPENKQVLISVYRE